MFHSDLYALISQFIFCTPRVYGYGFRVNLTSNTFHERFAKHVFTVRSYGRLVRVSFGFVPKVEAQKRLILDYDGCTPFRESTRYITPKNIRHNEFSLAASTFQSHRKLFANFVSANCNIERMRIIFYIISERSFRHAKAIRSKMLVCWFCNFRFRIRTKNKSTLGFTITYIFFLPGKKTRSKVSYSRFTDKKSNTAERRVKCLLSQNSLCDNIKQKLNKFRLKTQNS